MKDIKVASVQFEHAPGDKQANLDKVRRFTAEAAEQGVELVVFPEMCVTGYWFLRDRSREHGRIEMKKVQAERQQQGEHQAAQACSTIGVSCRSFSH